MWACAAAAARRETADSVFMVGCLRGADGPETVAERHYLVSLVSSDATASLVEVIDSQRLIPNRAFL
jgi:hypothetical protein